MPNTTPFASPTVAEAFDAFPKDVRPGALALRELIFSTAQNTPCVGRLEEVLKWGQPSYLTTESKSGTTIRLGIPKTGGLGIYVHCQTRVISEFRSVFPDELRYDGNRGILFDAGKTLPTNLIERFIRAALTYRVARPKTGPRIRSDQG